MHFCADIKKRLLLKVPIFWPPDFFLFALKKHTRMIYGSSLCLTMNITFLHQPLVSMFQPFGTLISTADFTYFYSDHTFLNISWLKSSYNHKGRASPLPDRLLPDVLRFLLRSLALFVHRFTTCVTRHLAYTISYECLFR